LEVELEGGKNAEACFAVYEYSRPLDILWSG
jgi:hypothetical protein